MTDRDFERLRIGIVGGSLGGLFAATLLKQDGHAVTVFERSHSGLARRGAGLVAQPDLYELLLRLQLRDAAGVGVSARERITLNRYGSVIQRDPTPQTQVSWDYLYEQLRARLTGKEYLLGQQVRYVDTVGSHALLEVEHGAAHEFDVIIGADGASSVVRRYVAPADHDNHYVGYSTWRGLIPETALEADSALVLLEKFAFFNSTRAHMLGYLVPGPDGETVVGRRRYNWVWYRPISPAHLRQIMVASGRPEASLSTAPGDLPGDLRTLLVRDANDELPAPFANAVVAEPEPFLQAITDYVAPRFARGRVVVLGDAACVVRPHTAMGASKAAGDAMALSDALRTHIPEVALSVYDVARTAEARSIAEYGRRLGASLPFSRP
ncbi:FAD-dependent monooxygenase [Frondihabitans australicus]|uniref:2-polyprenyl-6-methoxyphenol hydroxylase-like FAD-dependent oxidoreductase n=1 Tax=Frondihabitans australicus TaxID=386892 RepID=A0A495IK77_9MICO|nr:FAD-dependent monooxygenase [Frondihabitans australicus]RKR76363.1 2-polyprenyl-6-methoxyphenol hydroxylase-like FAD-dependent oxidoreductase [Frondihabitans australicus]